MRFSSMSGTTSATVPMAARPTARIRKVFIVSPTFFVSLARWQSAQASFSETAAPHRPGKGYVEPGRPGCTIAATSGRVTCGVARPERPAKGEAELAGGFCFGDAGDSAINRDDYVTAPGGDRLQGVVVQAVAFVDAVGD